MTCLEETRQTRFRSRARICQFSKATYSTQVITCKLQASKLTLWWATDRTLAKSKRRVSRLARNRRRLRRVSWTVWVMTRNLAHCFLVRRNFHWTFSLKHLKTFPLLVPSPETLVQLANFRHRRSGLTLFLGEDFKFQKSCHEQGNQLIPINILIHWVNSRVLMVSCRHQLAQEERTKSFTSTTKEVIQWLSFTHRNHTSYKKQPLRVS
jgi:hypothetical protein